MTAPRTFPPLGHLDDDELVRLAVHWRTQALRGDREANGIAHVLEVEQRRRLRVSQLRSLSPAPVAPGTRSRPWWRFWKTSFARAAGAATGPG